MSDFAELYGVTSEQALKFFYEHLRQEVLGDVTRTETLYVASMLAHYSQISRSNSRFMAPSGSLYDILDNFYIPMYLGEGSNGSQDPELLETAGSHTLLLVGFFRNQMKKSHRLEWYDHIGQSFFARVSNLEERKKAELLRNVALHFPVWVTICQNLNRTFQQRPYLIKTDM